ncbi:beta-phosphoglucomutase [Propionispira arboris]|uniref:Beta-phosphoglucomutase n=1 Tax=Propionispira arboris TaxID=84035 RepID=A0A1H7C081_9FIRM|nr:beta-phosphoglucomutase [Propionispira arboris]SEJ82007.1 beta-phosphoglucomutase [Propionispira arboris]
MKEAVIFDLDGVIVSTDEYHYKAWKKLADEEDIYFDTQINQKLRGVSRLESLEIILKKTNKTYTEEEKENLAQRKNNYYRELLKSLNHEDILPGVLNVLDALKEKRIKIAIGSSSKNTGTILKKIGLDKIFNAVVDGNQIKNSKPDPEVFLLAAKALGVEPLKCVVIEDADAGIKAALAAEMKAVAVGDAQSNMNSSYRLSDLTKIDINKLLEDG